MAQQWCSPWGSTTVTLSIPSRYGADSGRPPPPVERQRRETVTEEAGAPHLPEAGPALRPSFELAARAPPAPEPKRTPAPQLPQRAAQDDESILAEMALRLQTACGVQLSRSSQRSRRPPPSPGSPQRRPRRRHLPPTRCRCARLRRQPPPRPAPDLSVVSSVQAGGHFADTQRTHLGQGWGANSTV